ncbi:MAG: transposase [Firmicutes bacterium]|nr:transposase [Bacillota bacterium]
MDVPQVRDTEELVRLAVWEALSRRTDVLDRLVVQMYTRGLSTRDIEDALREATGGESVLARSTVSRISDALWEDYEAFSQRDLSGLVHRLPLR